ncbi:MAG: NPCBM/NEW2 domain-containing protein [Verrucomicrobiales bacterium]|nr:NPCBM/NEW2 domain-containing protein [Verrucomicrobiales bacterium]
MLKAAGINPDRETVLLFTNLSDWDPVNKTFVHKSPYYAKGSNLAGLAWQLDSPELDTGNLELKKPIIHDGEYGEISLGKHNSIFIGGIAHELGHALGLPHCRENSNHDKTALMGTGNFTYGDEIRGEGTGSFITLAHALRLASHPQFSGSVKGLNLPAKANFSSLAVTGGSDQFAISGHVRSSIPVYAVVAYLDPEGGDDYDSRTAVAVPDADGTFSITCRELVPGKPAQVRLSACLANGAVTTWQSTYRVDEDGTPNIEALETVLELGDFVDALNRNDNQSAKLFRDRFDRKTRNYKICSAILAGKNRNTAVKTLKEVSEDAGKFPLSKVAPKAESVGWWQPAYNHVPNESLLLISAGEVFTTGIYAHAESRHIYEVGDGNWSYLEGKCGLPPMRSGSVVFVIKTDGKEVFRSEVVRPNECTGYRINLSGVSELELLTEDADDGKASDWGMWFDPILHR